MLHVCLVEASSNENPVARRGAAGMHVSVCSCYSTEYCLTEVHDSTKVGARQVIGKHWQPV